MQRHREKAVNGKMRRGEKERGKEGEGGGGAGRKVSEINYVVGVGITWSGFRRVYLTRTLTN